MSDFKETRPAKLPLSYPNASRLVDRLLADVHAVLGDIPEDRLKVLTNCFHITARWHRHEIERFGKKWKRNKSRIGTKAE